jgi:nitrogen fixation/metabolism regulation signal transduction histidine kinase
MSSNLNIGEYLLQFTKSGSSPANIVRAEILFPQGSNPILYTFSSSIIVVYLACFGVFLFVTAFITRHVTHPLSELSMGLRRVATGELKSAIKISSQDEVGELANAYNVMIYRLQDLQEELAEAEREAAWSEMARQVAHEIKNPLTPMKLSLQHLIRIASQNQKSRQELIDDLQRTVDSVVSQIESLAHIASDFSRFARPLDSSFEEIDLHEMLMEVAELYRHDPKINLVFDLVERKLKIRGAKDDLKRVFINLIKNSDEAMPDGGIIMLRTYSYKENAVIEVVDNGEGIPVEEQSRIFTPNFSTKTSGTGLGLAICKKIIETHKGEISFASVPGAGTTFTLTIPQI